MANWFKETKIQFGLTQFIDFKISYYKRNYRKTNNAITNIWKRGKKKPTTTTARWKKRKEKVLLAAVWRQNKQKTILAIKNTDQQNCNLGWNNFNKCIYITYSSFSLNFCFNFILVSCCFLVFCVFFFLLLNKNHVERWHCVYWTRQVQVIPYLFWYSKLKYMWNIVVDRKWSDNVKLL